MIDQAVQISGQRGKGKKLFFSKYYPREEDKFDHVKLWRQIAEYYVMASMTFAKNDILESEIFSWS